MSRILFSPLWVITCVGLVLRLAAALSGHGFFASDDYWHVIHPAWKWAQGYHQEFSPFRSMLVPGLISWFLRTGYGLGITDPAWVLKYVYAILGVWSAAAIPGVYYLSDPNNNPKAARVAAWLMAGFAIMPRISTRALVEVICIPLLVWGLVGIIKYVETSAPVVGFFGALSLAMAAAVRFQTGVVFMVALAWVLLQRKPRFVLPLLAGGAVVVLLQGLLDLATHGAFFSSPVRYLDFNLSHASAFGTSPWYSYAGMLALLTLPPATIALLGPLYRALKEKPLVAASLAVFVLAHSMVGHKEERFLFPVLPLLFVLLAVALVEAATAGRWSRRAVAYFAVVNICALLVITFSDGQRSMSMPLLEVARRRHVEHVVWVGRRSVAPFYLNGAAELMRYTSSEELARSLPSAVHGRPVRFILSAWPDAVVSEVLDAWGDSCHPPRRYHGDFPDRLVLRVNPHRNRRRRPLTVIDCGLERPRTRYFQEGRP